MFTLGFIKTSASTKDKDIAGAMHSISPMAGATYSAMKHPKRSVLPFIISGAMGLGGLVAGRKAGHILSKIIPARGVKTMMAKKLVKELGAASGAYLLGRAGHDIALDQ